MDFIHEAERIYAQNDAGEVIAEIDFPVHDGIAEINHTFVDGSLRGQGVAGKLVAAAAEQLREAGLRILPTCSYAVKWFGDHPEYEDILTREK